MTDKYCGNCKYCGEVLKDDLHSCNNNKSIFKACLETATGCAKFEPQESEEQTVCDSCKTKGCIFQSGIVRSHCDFYKTESEVQQ